MSTIFQFDISQKRIIVYKWLVFPNPVTYTYILYINFNICMYTCVYTYVFKQLLLYTTSIFGITHINAVIHLFTVAEHFQITQCRVSKQILIHILPPVLILQMKRFSIGSHNVTKDNSYISFPHVLDMAPYCTTECVEVRMCNYI